jgi:hypothetical protein
VGTAASYGQTTVVPEPTEDGGPRGAARYRTTPLDFEQRHERAYRKCGSQLEDVPGPAGRSRHARSAGHPPTPSRNSGSNLGPQQGISNAAPTPQQRRRDCADQLTATQRRYGRTTPTPSADASGPTRPTSECPSRNARETSRKQICVRFHRWCSGGLNARFAVTGWASTAWLRGCADGAIGTAAHAASEWSRAHRNTCRAGSVRDRCRSGRGWWVLSESGESLSGEPLHHLG